MLLLIRYTLKMTKQDFRHNVFSYSERIYPMVARMLGKSNASDAIQDIMLKLWEKRFEIENHPNLKGLIFLTARNYCIDELRKKAKNVSDSEEKLRVLKARKTSKDIEWSELNNIVAQIIKSLPKPQQDVFQMRDLDGFETDEIAELLGIKREHVRVLLSRARKYIGVELEKTYNYERGVY